eukprot:7315016-Prymnesium_polylepis.2
MEPPSAPCPHDRMCPRVQKQRFGILLPQRGCQRADLDFVDRRVSAPACCGRVRAERRPMSEKKGKRFSLSRSSTAKETATKAAITQPAAKSTRRDSSKRAGGGEKMLGTIVLELPLPLGIGLDELNVVQEIGKTGSAAEADLLIGDRVTHVDGMEVRDGKVDVAEALDRGRSNHVLVLQRLVDAEPGVAFLTVRLAPKNGSLGIGLTDRNVVSELVRGSASDDDGRLQIADELLVVNGWDVRDGK